MKKALFMLMLAALFAGPAAGDDLSDALGKTTTGVAGLIGGMSMAAMMWSVIFSGIGVGAFLYGKNKSNAAFIVIGILLSVYPYAVRQTLMIVLIGAALCGALYFFRKG